MTEKLNELDDCRDVHDYGVYSEKNGASVHATRGKNVVVLTEKGVVALHDSGRTLSKEERKRIAGELQKIGIPLSMKLAIAALLLLILFAVGYGATSALGLLG